MQIQKETAEIDLKEYVSGVRNVIKSMAAEVSKLSRYVHEGKEPRAVECYGQMNLRRSVIELVRNDTGEIVDSRPMTPEEYQLTLAGIEEDSPVAKNVRTIK